MVEPGTESDLKAMYDSHNGRLPVTFEVFVEIVRDWNIWRIVDSEPIAVVLEKNKHAHIGAINGKKVGIKAMKIAIDELGIRFTTVSNEFRKGHSLAKRLGFIKITDDGAVSTYQRG